jgi:hypothetical protein
VKVAETLLVSFILSAVFHLVGFLVTWGMKREGSCRFVYYATLFCDDCSSKDRWTPDEIETFRKRESFASEVG